jgi:hypothetical protein
MLRNKILVAVKYHHVVRKNENGKIFHDQIGHWIYEPSTNLVMHSLTIPRGVCVLAGGTITENDNEKFFKYQQKMIQILFELFSHLL